MAVTDDSIVGVVERAQARADVFVWHVDGFFRDRVFKNLVPVDRGRDMASIKAEVKRVVAVIQLHPLLDLPPPPALGKARDVTFLLMPLDAKRVKRVGINIGRAHDQSGLKILR